MRSWNVKRSLRCAFFQLCRHLCIHAMMALSGVRYFNVPDMQEVVGGLLIVANHQSYLDPVLVGMALGRPINYVARSSLFRLPGFTQLIRALGAHPINRGEVDRSGLKGIIKLLRKGEPLLLFPEGTRTSDGSLGEFGRGAGSLAVRCGVPVLPVCIEGAFRCWPRHRTLPRPARVAVAFGRPLSSQGCTAHELTRRVAAEIQRLQHSLRRYLQCGAADPCGGVAF